MPWDQDPTPLRHQHRIYGDNRESVFALIDEEDYHWAVQWSWGPKLSRGGSKIYLYRHSRGVSYYLHKEIMKRNEPEPPSPEHTIADHRNGQSLDCRRANLRWATPSQNSLNINGRYAYNFLV